MLYTRSEINRSYLKGCAKYDKGIRAIVRHEADSKSISSCFYECGSRMILQIESRVEPDKNILKKKIW